MLKESKYLAEEGRLSTSAQQPPCRFSFSLPKATPYQPCQCDINRLTLISQSSSTCLPDWASAVEELLITATIRKYQCWTSILLPPVVPCLLIWGHLSRTAPSDDRRKAPFGAVSVSSWIHSRNWGLFPLGRVPSTQGPWLGLSVRGP